MDIFLTDTGREELVRRWGRKLAAFLARPSTPPVCILLLTAAAVVLLFPFAATVQNFNLPQVGEAARETVIAPFTFDVLKSPEELERERTTQSDKVLLVLDFDTEHTRRMQASLKQLRMIGAALAGKKSVDSASHMLRRDFSKLLSENAQRMIDTRPELALAAAAQAGYIIERGVLPLPIVASRERIRDLQERYNASFTNYLLYSKQYVSLRRDTSESAVDIADLPVKEEAFDKALSRLRKGGRFDADELNTVYELLAAYVQPNITVNETETQRRKERVAAEVLPFSGKVVQETEIVRKHQEVTPAIQHRLESLRAAIYKRENMGDRRKVAAGNMGRLLFVMAALLFLCLYVRSYQPGLMKNPAHLSAFALLLVFQLLVIRFCLLLMPRLFEGAADVPALQPEYFVPIAAGASLAAILFGREPAFFLALFVSIFFGVILEFSQLIFLYALFTGVTACLASRNIRYRWEYFKVIPMVLASAAVCILLWHFINARLPVTVFLQNVGLAAVGVTLSLLLAMTLSPLFERFFDITTDMTLVELSDMNHPVLKRLSIEAAGTYNHSVLVGNLAESAAERIGANPLLSRVASYYHDIGKIEMSDYFVENALGLDRNRHNKLAPSMSALIILSHVKEGVELARRYRLPQVIRDVITQHHGTGWVSFFYEKALEQDPHKQVRESDFHYPGPRPQTRETAIILLADSVEAASRSLGSSSPRLLRDLVKKIIRDKFMDGQLDQCNLTLRDLDGIVEGFMPVLQGMFHSRVRYPNQ